LKQSLYILPKILGLSSCGSQLFETSVPLVGKSEPLIIPEAQSSLKSQQNGEVPGLDANKNAEKWALLWPTKSSYLNSWPTHSMATGYKPTFLKRFADPGLNSIVRLRGFGFSGFGASALLFNLVS
jgi:hypothetical protein